MEYIPINSTDDIDLGKISSHDLTKRYIDPQGNKYAVKYDFKNRKLKVVQIIQGKVEALAVRERRTQKRPAPGGGGGSAARPVPAGSHQAADRQQQAPENDNFFEENPDTVRPLTDQEKVMQTDLLEETKHEFTKTRERIKAIQNNLKRSTYFDKHNDPRMRSFLTDMDRVLDNDCVTRMEDSVNLLTELTKFPRPLSFYYNKLTKRRKAFLEQLANEKEKLEYVKAWELYETFSGAIEITLENLKIIQAKIIHPNEHLLNGLDRTFRQAFLDGKASLDYAIQELHRLSKKILAWKNTIHAD